MYIGLGYDAHRFSGSRRLVLGGVHIENSPGLEGHSDADVLLHALMDALLGAAGLSDIGSLFPNTDPIYKDISSIKLLKNTVDELKRKNLKPVNVDITLIAEKPKISPFIPKMKNNISEILGIPAERVGIKATTNEKMGFIGRGEGMAAMAVALVEEEK